MDLNLKNKRVLITGGSKGIGLACARLFHQQGARVAVVARNNKSLQRCEQELGVYTCAADLSDAAAAVRMIDKVETDFGAIDILVNSAGAAERRVVEDLNPAFWRAAMDAKFFSYINVIDPLIKRMAARGAGVIVNIIGTGGKIPSPVHIAGGSANAALMLATAGLASVYASSGVRVCGISPGLTNTARVGEGLKAEAMRMGVSSQEALDQIVGRLPLGRIAEPEDIANIVAFAASDYGVFLTGANITADGAATPCVV